MITEHVHSWTWGFGRLCLLKWKRWKKNVHHVLFVAIQSPLCHHLWEFWIAPENVSWHCEAHVRTIEQFHWHFRVGRVPNIICAFGHHLHMKLHGKLLHFEICTCLSLWMRSILTACIWKNPSSFAVWFARDDTQPNCLLNMSSRLDVLNICSSNRLIRLLYSWVNLSALARAFSSSAFRGPSRGRRPEQSEENSQASFPNLEVDVQQSLYLIVHYTYRCAESLYISHILLLV